MVFSGVVNWFLHRIDNLNKKGESEMNSGSCSQMSSTRKLVCYTAVFSVVTQRSSSGEERCVTTLKTAV